jgi:uncharacterized protein (TIGR02996 family)
MTEDEPFLRALLVNPDDRVARLVYADWLDDHADPRAAYLRLYTLFSGMQRGDRGGSELRKRLLDLQLGLPTWWVVIAGGLRATARDETFYHARVDAVGAALGSPVKRTDAQGYEISICSGALSGLTGAVAYLESRSKWIDQYHDIRYHLRLRDSAGHEVSWESHTYNPFFGCRTRFLEWYGERVVFIYREKHDTYICRFGFDGPPKYQQIEDAWIIDGRVLAYRGWRESCVRGLSVPDLDPLPTLSEEEAAGRDLLPVPR